MQLHKVVFYCKLQYIKYLRPLHIRGLNKTINAKYLSEYYSSKCFILAVKGICYNYNIFLIKSEIHLFWLILLAKIMTYASFSNDELHFTKLNVRSRVPLLLTGDTTPSGSEHMHLRMNFRGTV